MNYWFVERKYDLSEAQWKELEVCCDELKEHQAACAARYWVNTGVALSSDEVLIPAIVSYFKFKLEEKK